MASSMPKPKLSEMSGAEHMKFMNAVFSALVQAKDFSLEGLTPAFKKVLSDHTSMKWEGKNVTSFRTAFHKFVTESTNEQMIKNRNVPELAKHIPTWIKGSAAPSVEQIVEIQPVISIADAEDYASGNVSKKEFSAAMMSGGATQAMEAEWDADEMIQEDELYAKELAAKKEQVAAAAKKAEQAAKDLKKQQEELAAEEKQVAAHKQKALEVKKLAGEAGQKLAAERVAAELVKKREEVKRNREGEDVENSPKRAKPAEPTKKDKADFKAYFLAMDAGSRKELVDCGVCSVKGEFLRCVALTKKSRDDFRGSELKALEAFGVIEQP